MIYKESEGHKRSNLKGGHMFCLWFLDLITIDGHNAIKYLNSNTISIWESLPVTCYLVWQTWRG